MRMKHVIVVSVLMVIAATAIGLKCRAGYRDLNAEEEPLDNFIVPAMPPNFLEMVLDGAMEQLDDDNIILAVTCTEATFFRPHCTTEKVRVQKIFKGEGLAIGEEIEFARENTHIFMDEEMRIAGKPCINMGFVNQMIVGKSYLIFLDKKLVSMDETEIYVQPEDIMFAPIFCYEALESYPLELVDEDSNSVEYVSAKGSEFFFSSQEDLDKMQAFKAEMLAKYPLDQ